MTGSIHPGTIVVGAGLMGRWHVHALKHLGIPVAAIVDADVQRASELAKHTTNAIAVATIKDTPAKPGMAAHLCTPLDSHYALAAELLDRGLHCLTEKPLAPTAAETKNLLDRAGTKGLVLCPVHQFPFQHGFRRVQKEMHETGPVRHIDATIFSAGAEGHADKYRTQIVYDIVPHHISLLRRLMGRNMNELDWRTDQISPGEFRAFSTCGDASLGILISMSGRPTQNTLRVACKHATFHVDLFHGFRVRETGTVSRVGKATRPFSLSARSAITAASNLARRAVAAESAYPGLRELVQQFHRSVSYGGEWPVTAEETMDVAELRDRFMVGSVA